MTRELVYIAGPYANPDPVVNTRIAVEAGMEVWAAGGVPLIPHLTMFVHFLMPQDIDFWYAYDIAHLAHCGALIRLPGASSGADAEVAFARERYIPIHHGVDEWKRHRRADA